MGQGDPGVANRSDAFSVVKSHGIEQAEVVRQDRQ